MNKLPLLGAAVAAALAIGCATTPKTVPELVEAHAAVERLTSDPLASQSATRELQAARGSLDNADNALKKNRPQGEVVHYAYLAKRQAETGEARLAEVRAKEKISKGEAARNAVRLEAREREVDLARNQAAANAADAEAARQSALSAQQRAEEAQRALDEQQRALAELQAKQTERGMVLTLGDVLFDTGRSELKPGAATTLDRVAKYLNQNAETRVLIEGYTDSRGTAEYNQQLSAQRASSVASALETRGVSRDRIDTSGKGEELPVASNDTSAGRQLNRRVEIVFSDADGKFADKMAQR
ncbi:MAG TPA: OmpA family protein [Steroidobacteraceae bacterium]|nr:OmpA family protein [Steroidobacteraceae bacterium]